jgi:hypothetical protein
VAANSTSLTVTARAVDKASGPLGDVGKSVKALPEQFGKASAAMSVLGGVSQQLGGQIGGAAQKLSGLASMVASGGPIGIGIAAISVAVAAGSKMWEAYTESTRQAELAAKSLDSVFASQVKGIEDSRRRVDDLSRSLRNFGLSSSEATKADLERKMATQAEGVSRLSAEIAKLEERNKQITDGGTRVVQMYNNRTKSVVDLTSEQEEEIRLNEIAINGMRTSAANIQRQIELDKQAVRLTADLAEKERGAARAKRTHADATHELIRAERERKRVNDEALALLDDIQRMEDDARDKTKRAAKAFAEGVPRAFGEAAKGYDKAADEMEQRAKAIEAAQAAMAQRLAGNIVGTVGGAFDEIVSGSKSAEQAFGDLFKSLARMALQQAATYVVAKGIEMAADKTAATVKQQGDLQSAAVHATAKAIEMAADQAAASAKHAQDTSTAASGAMSAHSNIPFIGIAIGLAAAAAIVGAIMAFKKFAAGGVATGGVPGMDSVPAMLTPGERVLTVSQTNAFENFVGLLERIIPSGGLPTPALAGAGAGAGGLTVINNLTVQPSDRGEPDTIAQERYGRDMARLLDRAARDGVFRAGR